MNKIILLVLLLTVTYTTYAQPVNYLQRTVKEPEGIATIVFSRNGYEIIEYQYSRMEPDPYSGPGLFSMIHQTTIFKYKGIMYTLFTTPDKVLIEPKKFAYNFGERFLLPS